MHLGRNLLFYMGLLITLERPTRGIEEAAQHSGTFTWPVNRQPFPAVQLPDGRRSAQRAAAEHADAFLPYIQAKRLVAPTEQLTLG
jgi:hypothetical protein